MKLITRKYNPIDSGIIIGLKPDNIPNHNEFLLSLYNLSISFDLNPILIVILFLMLIEIEKIEINHSFKENHDDKKEKWYNLVPYTFDRNAVSDKEQFDKKSESDYVKEQVNCEISFSSEGFSQNALSFWRNVLAENQITLDVVSKRAEPFAMGHLQHAHNTSY
jgi:hypothetical protein